MATRIHSKAFYDLSADQLWRHVVRYEALEAAMSGTIVRVKCPAGEEQAGHDVGLVFKMFGIVPVGRWRFKVVARDDVRRRLRSEESGTGVRRWSHDLTVDEVGAGRSCLNDTIEIDAGILTPLVAWFATFEYARRHALRKKKLTGAND